jgi:hypothetical protein
MDQEAAGLPAPCSELLSGPWRRWEYNLEPIAPEKLQELRELLTLPRVLGATALMLLTFYCYYRTKRVIREAPKAVGRTQILIVRATGMIASFILMIGAMMIGTGRPLSNTSLFVITAVIVATAAGVWLLGQPARIALTKHDE